LGHGRYLAFYLACGLAASVAHLVFNPTSVIPAVGASGAIAGVLGCYMRLFPLARVIVLVPILFIPLFFEVHAFVFVGLWFVIQILQGTLELVLPSSQGGVAWWAHVGGFVAGFVLGPYWYNPSGATRNTTPTKAFSASTRQDAFVFIPCDRRPPCHSRILSGCVSSSRRSNPCCNSACWKRCVCGSLGSLKASESRG